MSDLPFKVHDGWVYLQVRPFLPCGVPGRCKLGEPVTVKVKEVQARVWFSVPEPVLDGSEGNVVPITGGAG